MSLIRPAAAGALVFVAARGLFGCASILSLPNEVDPVDASPEAANEAATTTDFYVDHAGGNGVFLTIGDAVAAANLSIATQKTIHVAAGGYTQSSGEVFPIELRDGISLEGAGAGVTTVRGTGPLDINHPTIFPTADVVATFVIGDTAKQSKIARMTIVSDGVAKADGYEAIVCDRGNLTGAGPSSPSTIVSEVTIDGFEIGVRVMGKTLPTPSACNLLLRASVIQNGAVGAHAEGSVSSDGTLNLVSLQIGDGTPGGGNEFRALRVRKGEYGANLQDDGTSVSLREAVTGVVVRGNHFVDSDIGIWSSVAKGTATDLDIRDNDFDTLANAGVLLWGANVANVISNNSFHGISTRKYASEMFWHGVGLILDDAPTAGLYPSVRSARGNSFFGNDVGIDIRNSNNQVIRNKASTVFDFGTDADPGNNVFRCNSRAFLQPYGTGGDLRLPVYASAGVTFRFAGNVWDHAPPHLGTDNKDPGSEGLDVLGSLPGFDPKNATATTTPACPEGILSGP